MPVTTANGTGSPSSCSIPPRREAVWPRRAFLDLGAVSTAPRCARAWAREIMREWGADSLADPAELVASELVTNGVRASRAVGRDVVRISLVSDLSRVVVFVWDASTRPPVKADPVPDAENGRGLVLVEAVTESWGYFGCEGGKVVWAALPV